MITKEKEKAIVILYDSGEFWQSDIARILNISKTQVSCVLQKAGYVRGKKLKCR